MSRRRGIPWLVLIAGVVVGAALQALTAAPGLGRMPDGLFALAAVGSAAVLWLQLVAIAGASHAIVAPSPRRSSLRALALASAIAVALIAVIAVLVPWLLPLVAIAVLCTLPGIAAGRGALSGLAVLRRVPWRATVFVIVALIAVALSWVVALLTGLFLTAALGGLAMWLWFGAVFAALVLWWARLDEAVARAAERP